jgi:hypothetical protein
MSGKQRKKWLSEREGEIISLVDVAFLLLIFFLVIASMGRMFGGKEADQISPSSIIEFPRVDEIVSPLAQERIYGPVIEGVRLSKIGRPPYSSMKDAGWLFLLVDAEKYKNQLLSEVNERILNFPYSAMTRDTPDWLHMNPDLAFIADSDLKLSYRRFLGRPGVRRIEAFLYKCRQNLSRAGSSAEGELVLRFDRKIPMRIVRAIYQFAAKDTTDAMGRALPSFSFVSFAVEKRSADD